MLRPESRSTPVPPPAAPLEGGPVSLTPPAAPLEGEPPISAAESPLLSAQERRQTTRVECCYQVRGRHGEESFEASVVNMGMGGMRLLCAQELVSHDTLILEQASMHSGPVTVRVVWSRPQPEPEAPFVVGVVYHGSVEQLENSWVKPTLGRLGFDSLSGRERRRYIRAREEIRARLWSADESVACQLFDLGLGGALVQADRALPEVRPGERVFLEVSIGETERLPARVVYERTGPTQAATRAYGLAFETDASTRAQTRLVESILQSMMA